MNEIHEGRKALHLVGTIMIVVGFLVFASTFLVFFWLFGNPGRIGDAVGSFLVRPLAGMGLVIVGGILRTLAARGLAGSGVILDPEQARRDLEPFSRMAGGMAKDALKEADLKGVLGAGKATPAVMIRCLHCRKLNEEDSKFCQECGKAI